MAAGKTQFTGSQSLLVGRNRACRAQSAMVLLEEVVVAWWRFPKDTVLLTLALLTLRRSLKLFRAVAKMRHRGGSLSMQANIFIVKERRCTPEKYGCVHWRSEIDPLNISSELFSFMKF